MKKLLLLVAVLPLFSCVNAQTVVSGHLSVTMADSMSHDSTMCQCHYNYYFSNITVDSSYLGDSLRIVDTNHGTLIFTFTNTTGASPWIVTTPYSWGTRQSDISALGPALPGYYRAQSWVFKVATRLDTVFLFNRDSLYVAHPCLYDTAQGRVYIDNNSNCIFDGGDVGIIEPNPSILENLSSPGGSLSNIERVYSTGGRYLFFVQKSWMVNYSISLPSYYSFIFPFSTCYPGPAVYTTLPVSNIDFPLQCSHLIDVVCDALAPPSVRLHRAFYMQAYVSNTGCDTASGTMTLVKDHRVAYDALLSTHPADTVRGDTLIWKYSALTSLSLGTPYWNKFMSDIYLSPDTTVVAGDTLCFRVYSNIPPTDIDAANNDHSFCLPVVYSYDPNEKEVSPKGTGPQGYISPSQDTLTYTLHFQNTGSAYAENIKVVDTLDSHINPSSLRILGTSHKMWPEWLAPNVVRFNFDGIYLPDSGANEAASHGQVQFKVALNAGLPYNTQIKNKGYIYFDLNPPVITNTTLNTIDRVNNVSQVTAAAVKVYPNPATDYIVAENLKGGELSILNVNGVVVIKQSIATDKATIDVSMLPGGVYILKTVNNLNTTTVKFTKY